MYDVSMLIDNDCPCSRRGVEINAGSSTESFKHALRCVLHPNKMSPKEVVYFVEDDYIHRPGSREALLEGIDAGFDYVTLYDHPDKYISGKDGGNPDVHCPRRMGDADEISTVLYSKSCHWKFTNSTTMTFAARRGTIKADADIIGKHLTGPAPDDFWMFCELLSWPPHRRLGSSIPAFATHAEKQWLAPLFDWEAILNG